MVRRGCRRIIKLINKRDPEITGAYSDNVFVPFDSVNFDKLPFGQALNYPRIKTISVNRSSLMVIGHSRHNLVPIKILLNPCC